MKIKLTVLEFIVHAVVLAILFIGPRYIEGGYSLMGTIISFIAIVIYMTMSILYAKKRKLK